MHDLPALLKNLLLSQPDVIRLSALRRSTCLFVQGERADALYFIEEGLIKLTRTRSHAGRLILSVYGRDEVVGEECLFCGEPRYHAEATVMTAAATVHRIPCETMQRIGADHPELGIAVVQYLLGTNLKFAHKVELLCLHDVETRILHHLDELSHLVKRNVADAGYALPITQLELADLVGATRETTSTTLNHLQSKGLVKLSRRLLTVFPQRARAAAASDSDGDIQVL